MEEGDHDDGVFRAFVEEGETAGRAGAAATAAQAIPTEERLSRLRAGVVGAGAQFDGPFGARQVVYADWTASGRAYGPIEDYVRERVLPFYANTHTSTSISGLQSTCFRAEARQIVQQAVNANSRLDVVLFTGSGATGAINKMASILGLKVPLTGDIAPEQRPVVLCGPFDHHSNILPWRESNADVFTVREDRSGCGLDQAHLVELLKKYQSRPLVVGAFSAASNVTGVQEDVNQVSALLHRYGALALWDYAAAGPYVNIDMNPVLPGDHPDRAFVHKDAVFISPHKFVGGVNSPGILIAKKRLFDNAVPAGGSVGGGTVYFVKEDGHRYLSNRVEREEGGTPDVVGAIRAGLAFQLKQSIGVESIAQVDARWTAKIREALGTHPNIALLGPEADASGTASALPIASFLIRHGPSGRLFLHYNFVSAVLNDVFGIQTRGGCMCAGPYAQRLLGMQRKAIDAIEAELVNDPKNCEYLRPGFSRLSLAYFASEEEVNFCLDAVRAVAENGWRLLPLYRFNRRTGEWKHKSQFTKFVGRLWLEDAGLLGEMSAPSASPTSSPTSSGPIDFARVLAEGKALLLDTQECLKEMLGDQKNLLSDSATPLRWFLLPSEALDQLRTGREASANVAAEADASVEVVASTIDQHGTSTASRVVDPAAYWKFLRDTRAERNPVDAAMPSESDSTTSSDTSGTNVGADSRKTKVASDADQGGSAKRAKTTEVVCADNSCFRIRSKDKFPLRTAEVIRQDATGTYSEVALKAGSAAETTGDKLIGKEDMDKATLRPKPPRGILRSFGKAVAEWDMIRDGDRLLLGLSGGKDSLCLLHVLLDVQARAPIKFEIAACTIDPMTEAFDPSPLIPYLESLGVKYHYIKQPIFDLAKSGSLQGTSICAFCARMKRGALYTCAREHGYTTLVLAQHLDDFAESLVMSMFHNGHLRTMQANYSEKKGDLRIIRPFAYVRENECKEFSYSAKLPVINDNCPACFQAPQERRRVKKLLAKEEAQSPRIFSNLRRALIPLMDPEVLADLAKARTDRERRGGRYGGAGKPYSAEGKNKSGQPGKSRKHAEKRIAQAPEASDRKPEASTGGGQMPSVTPEASASITETATPATSS